MNDPHDKSKRQLGSDTCETFVCSQKQLILCSVFFKYECHFWLCCQQTPPLVREGPQDDTLWGSTEATIRIYTTCHSHRIYSRKHIP